MAVIKKKNNGKCLNIASNLSFNDFSHISTHSKTSNQNVPLRQTFFVDLHNQKCHI